MLEKVEDGILVVAEMADDRRLVEELLLGTGFAEQGEVPSGAAAFEALQVTIVCHRASRAAPLPELPSGVELGRVVVFSDCTSEHAVVDTLEAGAHHYFDIDESPRVLQARLTAALRSCLRHAQRELLVPPFRFDLSKRRVWREERPIGLSPKEFDLALYLFSNRGRTVGNRELMSAVWSLPRTSDTRRIDTAACRVRKKMSLESAAEPWRLSRLRGEGYVLVAGKG